jgi:hypothetical protein
VSEVCQGGGEGEEEGAVSGHEKAQVRRFRAAFTGRQCAFPEHPPPLAATPTCQQPNHWHTPTPLSPARSVGACPLFPPSAPQPHSPRPRPPPSSWAGQAVQEHAGVRSLEAPWVKAGVASPGQMTACRPSARNAVVTSSFHRRMWVTAVHSSYVDLPPPTELMTDARF